VTVIEHRSAPRILASRLLAREDTLWLGTMAVGIAGQCCLGLSCPFRQVTGLDCPGCGGTRAVLALGRGQLAEALHYNACVFLLIGVAVGCALRHPDGLPAMLREASVARRVLAVSLVLGWTVLRNLPQFGWLNTGWKHP
jgi:hypothetical protein